MRVHWASLSKTQKLILWNEVFRYLDGSQLPAAWHYNFFDILTCRGRLWRVIPPVILIVAVHSRGRAAPSMAAPTL